MKFKQERFTAEPLRPCFVRKQLVKVKVGDFTDKHKTFRPLEKKVLFEYLSLTLQIGSGAHMGARFLGEGHVPPPSHPFVTPQRESGGNTNMHIPIF